MNKTETRYTFTNPVLWGIFIIYLVISGFTMVHHEMWGDEIHSWNIAKASGSFFELISNTRYEGHPPLWYVILWGISKFTHDPQYVQVVHLVIACLVVFFVLFYSPFPFFVKLLVPFGYFFLFEYAVLSRNYAIGILPAFYICIIMHKNFRGKIFLYYLLLFLMANTHLLALLLAVSLHFYFLFLSAEQRKKFSALSLHLVTGVVVLLPAVYFIFPPSDSGLNIGFWAERWDANHFKSFAQAPLRAFIPVPAWWNYNCWNTHFLMEEQHRSGLLKLFNLLVSVATLVLAAYFFKGNKKSFILFTINLLLSFIVAVLVFPLTRERYAGFLFIGFITAFWLYNAETPVAKTKKWLAAALLAV